MNQLNPLRFLFLRSQFPGVIQLHKNPTYWIHVAFTKRKEAEIDNCSGFYLVENRTHFPRRHTFARGDIYSPGISVVQIFFKQLLDSGQTSLVICCPQAGFNWYGVGFDDELKLEQFFKLIWGAHNDWEETFWWRNIARLDPVMCQLKANRFRISVWLHRSRFCGV